MSTRNYGLPTVDPDTRLDFVNAVNGLAVSTDAVLHGVASSFPTDAYDLPVATSETLGGVRVGDGFRVYSDGLLTTAADAFELEPATQTTLGGVAIGSNVTDDGRGTIGIGAGAFGDIEANEKTLGRGSVTTPKLQDNAVTVNQVDSIVLNNLKGPSALWKDAQKTEVTAGDFYDGITFYVIVLSPKVKVVILDTLKRTMRPAGETYELPTTQGQFGSGKTVVTFTELDTDTSNTFSLHDEIPVEINFDDNTITPLADFGTGVISGNVFTTPGIIITD